MRQDHWFSFKDSCVSVIENNPSASRKFKHALFFLHGRFGDAEMWQPLIEGLAPQFRCVNLDFPGFGRSFLSQGRPFSLLEYASLVHELIQKFTLTEEKAILVGHDFGGGIAQLCTIKSPRKVAALVLINSAGLTRSFDKMSTRFQGWFVRRKLKQMLNQAEFMAPHLKAALNYPWGELSSRQTLIKAFRALDDSWPWHYERQVWKGELQNIDQPVLLLWGKNDTMNPPEMASELMQRLPEAYFYIHEQCSHWPSLEQPQWVLSKMKEFIFKMNLGLPIKRVQKFLSR
jgi:pimeloyl-ACP methyl ester carboxylesterase